MSTLFNIRSEFCYCCQQAFFNDFYKKTSLNYSSDVYTLLVNIVSGQLDLKQGNCIGVHGLIQLTEVLLNNILAMEI